jgi:hypothetical protein
MNIKRTYLTRGFWLSFAALAAFTIYGLVTGLFLTDVLIGLLVVIAGLHGLLYEYHQRLLASDRRRIRENFDYMTQWLDNSYTFLKSINSKHESRSHSIDVKRAQVEARIEETLKEMARKLADTEGRLNRTVKAAARDRKHAALRQQLQRMEKRMDVHLKAFEREKAEAVKRLVHVSARQHQALAFARRNGGISTRDYAAMFKASPKASLNELGEMVSRRLLKRTGKGRATRYVLGF